MTDREIPAFQRLWETAANYYGQTPDEARMRIYTGLLAEYAVADIIRAVEAHMRDPSRDARFFPQVGDIVRHIEGAFEVRATAAWDVATRAAQSVPASGYTSVRFPDPLTMAVIERMGGWHAFCAVPEREVPHLRRDFCARYQALLAHPPDRTPDYLPGQAEIENRGLDPTGRWAAAIARARLVHDVGGPRPAMRPVLRESVPARESPARRPDAGGLPAIGADLARARESAQGGPHAPSRVHPRDALPAPRTGQRRAEAPPAGGDGGDGL